jgi:hypothetical protein
VNKKVRGKMSLSKETLGNLSDASLKNAAGGHTHGTNVCTECTACASCVQTCMIDSGICVPSCYLSSPACTC